MPTYPVDTSLSSTDAVILCGGLGTRLQSVLSDRPKGLAPIGSRAFLDIVLDDLVRQGLRRIIFCVCHMKEQIIARYENRADAECVFSQEAVPLGTGGAVRNALPLIRSDPFLVMNGDSLCQVDLGAFYRFHVRNSSAASMVLTAPDVRQDCGTVQLNEAQRILSFSEKSASPSRNRFVNAGIYLLSADAMKTTEKAFPFSLEYDFLPDLVKTKPCFGFVVQSKLVDIGTPERYLKANDDDSQL